MQRRAAVCFLIAAALLGGSASSASTQILRIRGMVTDEHGAPVVGVSIEVTIAALTDADFAVRTNDRAWRTITDARGEYIVAVPPAGEYVVVASKEGIGSDRVRAASQRNNLVTVNLTLWTAAARPTVETECANDKTIAAFQRSRLAAGGEAGLGRLLGWLEAVQLHTPGCRDSPAIEVGRWPLRDLEVLLRDVRELVSFLQRTEEERAKFGGASSAQRDQLVFFIYGRRFTLDELQRGFYDGHPLRPNDILRRGALFHADIAMFVPGTLGRNPLVADGGRRGWRDGSSQWNVGRQLLDSIAPTPGSDARALLWYRAVAAYLFREGNLAELATHLRHGREVFPTSAEMLFDSACLHQELSSPAIQASIQALRASDVSVAVGTRASELQRAERFFREALAIAPAHVAARVRLGHTLGALGRHKEAAGELRTAIGGDLNPPLLYLAHLFVGSNEEALGRRAEARAHYEQAANMYPNAQSPRLALSGLARQTGDRARAQQSLAELAASSRLGIGDPWWNFYQPHNTDTDLLIAQMRSELSGWPGK